MSGFGLQGGRHLIAVCALVSALAFGCSSSEPEDPQAFCDALDEAGGIAQAVAPIDLDDPLSIADSIAELDNLVELAPADIEEDIIVVAEVYGEVLRAVAATAPGARADVLRDLQHRLDTAAQPALNLQNYGENVCLIRFNAPAQPTPTPTPLDIDD